MSRRPIASILVLLTLLLLTVVIPAAVQAGGCCHRPDGSVYSEGSTTVVKMDVCSFAPTIATVPVGTDVRFLNSSNIEHMVVGRSGSWASDMLQLGKEFSARFTTAGTYPFSCPLHPGMVGAIVVGGGVAEGAANAAAAPAGLTTGTSASSGQEADTAAAIGIDLMPLAVVGLVGLGIGAIAGALGAGAISIRSARG